MSEKKIRQPKTASEQELAKVGVTVASPIGLTLQCDTCGHTWSPNMEEGGRIPREYWNCPNGCNVPED